MAIVVSIVRFIGILLLMALAPMGYAQHVINFDTYNLTDSQVDEVFDVVPLENGMEYSLQIEGTYSIWAPSFWSNPCGTPESNAIFPSPVGFQTGTVGFDAEYMFALPEPGRCARFSLPSQTDRIEISLDGGNTWFHPTTPDPPNNAHVYHYAVCGQGFPVAIRHNSKLNSDDYGMLRFTFREKEACDPAVADLGSELEPSSNDNESIDSSLVSEPYGLNMPNVFTPNDDGINDKFVPIASKNISNASLLIYNRWGQKLFEGNVEQGWDGRTSPSSMAPDGVYYWTIEYSDPSNKRHLVRGYVQLIR